MPIKYTHEQWEQDRVNWKNYFLNKPVQLQDLYSRWDYCFAYTQKLAKEGNTKAIEFKNFIKAHHLLKPADQTPNLHRYYKKFRFDADDVRTFNVKEKIRNLKSNDNENKSQNDEGTYVPYEDVNNSEYMNFVSLNLFAPKIQLPSKWSLEHVNNAKGKAIVESSINLVSKVPAVILAKRIFNLANKVLKDDTEEHPVIEILKPDEETVSAAVAPVTLEEMQKLLKK